MLLLLIGSGCVGGFFEAFFEQAFHFGGGVQPQEASSPWPAGYPTECASSSSLSGVKGTEWKWNGWKNVRFNSDGSFEAPSPECTSRPGVCKWSCNDEGVFVLWGTAGLHAVKMTGGRKNGGFQPGERFEGIKHKDGSRIYMEFDHVFETQDLWAIFGLAGEGGGDQTAELKKRYRRLSLELHPDHNRNNATAVDQFRRMTEAYEILSDPVKRFVYELHGREGVNRLARGEFPKGDAKVVEIKVPLETLYSGGEVQVELTRRKVETRCSGGRCNTKCPAEVQTVHRQVGPGFFVQQQVRVDSKHFCKKVVETETLSIPRNIPEGTEIPLVGAGDQSPAQVPGDVVFRVFSKPHPEYRRVPNTAHLELTRPLKLPLVEALLGFSRTLKLLDGEELLVHHGEPIQHGQVFVFADKGLGGDLRVPIQVVFPKKLTEAQKSIIANSFL